MILRWCKRVWWLSALFMVAGSATLAQADDEAAGRWQGAVGTVEPLDVVVELVLVDGAWSGTIAIPATAEVALALTDVTVEEDAVGFVVADLARPAAFDGTLSDGAISGTVAYGEEELPFALARAEEAAAPAATAPADAYEDPGGVFSVPVPTGWTLREGAHHVVLEDPDDAIRLIVVTLEQQALAEAIEAAWERVEPTFAAAVDEVIEPPARPGVEEMLVIRYDAEPGLIVQAIAQLHEGVAHVFLVAAEREAAQRRDAEIDAVLTGYRILALEEVDVDEP